MNSSLHSKVDVLMPAYNHEAYIRLAIESVLSQKTSFKYRLLIGEDCSTDNTLQICKDYATRFPETIVLLANNPNVGLVKNFERLYKHSNAEFLAICDGDDLWSDNEKLQKEFDVLQSTPHLVGAFHQTDVINENSDIIRKVENLPRKEFLNFEILKIPMPAPSMFFKNVLGELPFEKFTSTHIDVFLTNLLAKKGGFVRLEGTAVQYREHSTSIFSKRNTYFQLKSKIKTRWMLLHIAESYDHKKLLYNQVLNYSRSGLSRSIKRDFHPMWTFRFASSWLRARLRLLLLAK